MLAPRERRTEQELSRGRTDGSLARRGGRNSWNWFALTDLQRLRETTHDPTDEPGVVPVGQIIPSTSPMAADRRRDVARMMITTMALTVPGRETRDSHRCDANASEIEERSTEHGDRERNHRLTHTTCSKVCHQLARPTPLDVRRRRISAVRTIANLTTASVIRANVPSMHNCALLL